jgi:hypothetical protein
MLLYIVILAFLTPILVISIDRTGPELITAMIGRCKNASPKSEAALKERRYMWTDIKTLMP